MTLDDLLDGAIDLHCHCYPEITLDLGARQDDVGLLRSFNEAKMGGVLLKSHFWPTVSKAYYLNKYSQGCRVYGSITLNNIAGGVSPLAVEAAALQGARAVFFPTWSAANDRQRKRFSSRVARLLPLHAGEDPPISITGQEGKLTPGAVAVLDLAKKFDLIIFTGHISVRESMELAREAVSRGIKIVFSHPSSGSVGATPDQVQAMAGMGAYIEYCCMTLLSLGSKTNGRELADQVKGLDPDRVILTSDAFGEWVPPAPEMLRMFVGMLVEGGLDKSIVRKMIFENPGKLIGQN